MREMGKAFLDFVLPRFCPCCRRKLQYYEPPVCAGCLSKIKEAESIRISSEFNRKFADNGIINRFTSCFVFEKDKELQQIIHSLKYGRKFLLGIYLGELLGERIKKEFYGRKIDMIVPIPLHHLRKAERQFNQSYYVTKGVSKTAGIVIKKRIIKRKRYTETQTTLKIPEREMNVRNAFRSKVKLDGESILLVDDVITTGSTISECGRILLAAGAAKIYAASAAIAD
jgi:ComF family protein